MEILKTQIGIMKLPYLRISLTPDCNAGCSFCHNEGQKIGKRVDDSSMVNSFLSLDQYREIAYEYKDYFTKVTFTGGEPTLVKQLPEIISIFKKAGYFTSMTSNAILLNDNLQKRLAKKGLDRINISLHSTNSQDYRRVFKVDKLSEVMDNLKLLNKNFTETCKINFMALPTKNIPSELIPMTELSSSNGVKISLMSNVTDRNIQRPLSSIVLDYLRANYNISRMEKSSEKFNTRRTYYFENGAIWEFDDFRQLDYRKDAFNNEVCRICTKRSRCTEGPYALRVTHMGIAKPCLIRIDNQVPILDSIQ